MSIFREIPPTAGFNLRAKELFLSLFSPNKGASFEEDLKKYLGRPYAKITCSGTAAFYTILLALKKISPKKTVVIPAFICPLVPLAVKRAGLKIKLCDIKPDNFDFDKEALSNICAEDPDILAIVATHLAGLPVDMQYIKKIAVDANAFVIEDCAQALGAEYQGEKVGRFGDFAFFSFCRGKGLSLYEGGAVVTGNMEYSRIVDAVIKETEKDSPLSEALKIIELCGLSFIYKPLFFWWAFRLPQAFWNTAGNKIKAAGDYFSEGFPVVRVSEFRKALGHIQFSRLNKEISSQRLKAAYLIDELSGLDGVKVVAEFTGTKSTYPFLTLIFDNPQKRAALLRKLSGLGLGVSQIYAYSLPDYDYLKDIIPAESAPHARLLAARHITLSTSSFLKESDLKKIAAAIKSL